MEKNYLSQQLFSDKMEPMASASIPLSLFFPYLPSLTECKHNPRRCHSLSINRIKSQSLVTEEQVDPGNLDLH